ncbi:MAG TPA: hypothetical protein VGE31_03215 [Candidatus Paceibacterota bacterium]
MQNVKRFSIAFFALLSVSSLLIIGAGYAWYSYVTYRADLAYVAFREIGKCSYLVSNKYYSFCGGTDPRLFTLNNSEDRLLTLAERGLKAELLKPRSSEERIRIYLNVISHNKPSPEILRMRTTSQEQVVT